MVLPNRFPTEYILKVYCANSGDSAYSDTFTETLNPFYLCYCGPLVGESFYLESYLAGDSPYETSIDYVGIVGTSLAAVGPTPDGTQPVYIQYWPTTSSTTADLQQGYGYTVNIMSECGEYGSEGYNYTTAAWIDYDHSGTFDAVDDSLNPEMIANNLMSAAFDTITATFTVPGNADTGLTGMRVRVMYTYDDEYSFGSGDACTAEYEEGTVNDFVINITQGIPCDGKPTAGTLLASTSTACLGTQPINLTDTGYTTDSTGLTYKWYYHATGGTADTLLSSAPTGPTIVGVTASLSYENYPTDYIFVETCTNSGLSDTSYVSVGTSPFYLCYCGPNTGVTLIGASTSYNYEEASLDLVSLSGTTLNNHTGAATSTTPLYTLYWPTTPTTTADIVQALVTTPCL